VFTAEAIAIGIVAAIIVGLSKTAIPAAGLLSVPLVATIVDGRLIAGTSLPLLIVADLFAVSWYRHHARWDLLRPLFPWLAVGYAAGITFYVAVGNSARPINIVIGSIVLLMVAIQIWRMIRRTPPTPPTLSGAATHGAAGGFTTFVSNSAGPVMNTYLVGLGLGKEQQVGTSAWFYFMVNVAKIPLYLALGWWTDGGHFFTADSLLWNLCLVPAIVGGVFAGRWLLPRISQEMFVLGVLVLSAAGGIRLLVG
jgi:uncharacterized membrane protein YfcA